MLTHQLAGVPQVCPPHSHHHSHAGGSWGRGSDLVPQPRVPQPWSRYTREWTFMVLCLLWSIDHQALPTEDFAPQKHVNMFSWSSGYIGVISQSKRLLVQTSNYPSSHSQVCQSRYWTPRHSRYVSVQCSSTIYLPKGGLHQSSEWGLNISHLAEFSFIFLYWNSCNSTTKQINLPI